MGRVWTAVSLGIVGLLIGGAAGPFGSLLAGGLGAAIGWNLAKPQEPQAEPSEADLPVRPARVPPAGAELERPAPQGEAIAIRRFLDDALRRGLVDEDTHGRLVTALSHRSAVSAPQTPAPAPLPAPPRPAPPQPERARPVVPPRPPTSAPPPSPPAWQQSLTATWSRIASDFAVHGLAYLGVLFVFVATLGFVIFAFSGVGAGYRPVAEVAIPTVLFGGARFLRSRGAPFVSRSLEFAGGALTPVVVFAALADESAFLPRLDDGPLVGALTAVSLVLAVVYAAVSFRRPESPLRFLVAPMVWVAAAIIGLALDGKPSAAQFAVAAWAVVATTAAAHLRPGASLSRPTIIVGGPGLLGAYALAVLFSSGAGWQPVPVIVVGVAAVTMAELLADRTPYRWAVQGIAVGITAAVAAQAWGPAPVGIAVVVAYLALAERWAGRADDAIATPALVGAAGVGVLAAAADPKTLLAAAAIGSAWAHYRRFRPADDSVTLVATGAAAGLPLAMAWPLVRLLGGAETALAAAALAAALVVAVRLVRSDDGFYRYWSAGLALAALAGVVIGQSAGEPAGLLAASAALASLAIAAVPGSRPLRAWIAGSGLLGALLLALEAASVAADARPGVVAVVATAITIAALTWRVEPAGHVAALSHIVVIGAAFAIATPTVRLVVMAAFTAGWLAESVAHEISGSALVRLIEPPAAAVRGGATIVRGAAPVLVAVSLPLLTADAADQWGLLVDQRGRMGLALAGLALAYASVARLVRDRRPLAPVAAIGGFVLAAVAIAVAAPEPWPTIVATATPIGVVAIIGSGLRRPVMLWGSWAISAVLTILLANRFGVAPADLGFVLAGWGAAALLGGLVADDVLESRREPGSGIRRSALVKPVALGAAAIPVALSFVLSGDPADWWAWAVAAATLYLVVAVTLRAGAVSTAFYALLALGLGGLSVAEGYSPLDHPWVFVVGATATAGVSRALEWTTKERDPWLGWDLAPLVVAHGLLAVGLAASVPAEAVPAVWAGSGALLLGIAVWKRRPAWAAGIVLVLIGAAAAGPGWLALALAGAAAAATAGGAVGPAAVRVPLRWIGAGLGGWAWVEALIWVDWSPDAMVTATGLTAGALALGLALSARLTALAEDWVWPWAALAAAGTAWTFVLAPEGTRESVGWSLTGSLAMWAVAAAAAAHPLGVPRFREAAAVLAVGAGATIGYAIDAGPADIVAAGLTTAVTATLLTVGLWSWRADSPWATPLTLVATLANAAAFYGAVIHLPDRALLVAVLAAAGLQAMAAGAVRRTVGYFSAGVVLLLVSWLTFAGDALGGNPHWYTLPTGIAVIALVDMTRWDRARTGRDRAADELVIADVVGVAMVAGASLMQTLTSSAAYGFLAMALGVGLCAWAAVTKVRHRLYGGAGVVVLAAVLMVAVPAAKIVPQFRGPALWAAVFGLGAAMIVAATYLERGRERVAAGIRRLEDILEDWE